MLGTLYVCTLSQLLKCEGSVPSLWGYFPNALMKQMGRSAV